jgi:thiol peroxidase
MTLSDHKEAEFGEKYAVLMKEPRVFRRAIFVVDRHDKVVYAAYMPKIGDEPQYEVVLDVARKAIGPEM